MEISPHTNRGDELRELFRILGESDPAGYGPSPEAVAAMPEELRHWLDRISSYKELRMMYVCALKEMRTKFEVLSTEFSVRHARNPISAIHTRIKSNASVLEKLSRRGYEPTLENMVNHISDVAGIRVICSYIDDIYMLAGALKRQNDVTLIAEKDYIRAPKESGYRSLHLVVSIPVFFAEQRRDMTVEVQIRTIAMDFWASLEHELKYKQAMPNPPHISRELSECAGVIARIDEHMLDLRRQIEAEALPAEAEDWARRIRSLDAPIG